MKKLNKIFLALTLAVFGLAFFVSNSQAQEGSVSKIPPLDKNIPTTKAIIIATVNIYDAKIVSQNNNVIKVAFDLFNREGEQPQIKYSVNLIQSKNNAQFVVDQKFYDDTVSLGAGETIHKEIEYAAPSYLTGSYQLFVTAQNEKSLPLGINMVGEVKLNGSGQYLEIAPDSCYLSVDGEAADKKYTLTQGVDVDKDENLVAHCDVTNNFKTAINAASQFETHYRTVAGKLISTQKKDSIILQPGEKKQIVIAVPKVDSPQAYDTVLSFFDEGNKSISNDVNFHFVIRGASATIQNLRIDKDSYKKGETAKISLNWSASADSFPNSRKGKTEIGMLDLDIVITDSSGKTCISPISKKMTEEDQQGVMGLEALIISDCNNPKVSVSIKDSSGKILDENFFNLANGEKVSQEGKVMTDKKEKNNSPVTAKNAMFLLALLLVVAVAVYLFFKKRKTGLMIFLFVCGSFFVGHDVARADTFVAGAMNYTVNLNKAFYSPGEKIVVTGQAGWGSCSNYAATPKLDVVINNTGYSLLSQYVFSGSVVGTAQMIPGNYIAGFYAAVCGPRGRGGYGCAADTYYQIPYTVIQADYSLNTAKNGSGNGIVTSSDSKINCGGTCSANYPLGGNTPVTLNASATDSNSRFSGWSGDCVGTGNSCNLTMNSNKSATATFEVCSIPVNPQVICNNPEPVCAADDCDKKITGQAFCTTINTCGNPVSVPCGATTCQSQTTTCKKCDRSWKEVAP